MKKNGETKEKENIGEQSLAPCRLSNAFSHEIGDSLVSLAGSNEYLPQSLWADNQVQEGVQQVSLKGDLAVNIQDPPIPRTASQLLH